ncbi:MAG: Na+/H+ antiporter NhaC [Pseudomonadota bacterium]|nr:Na+/H+ antiporter NhaC [Pseudomonadota bacterium]
MTSGKRQVRELYLWEALISLLSLVVGIVFSIAIYGMDPQIPMLLGVVMAALMAWRAGYSWKDIEAGMVSGITHSLQAIMILLIVGILIGVWIQSGVVPTLLYYGLDIIHPQIFLVATVLICAVTSLATGSSWGTSGTIGVALMGIGGGLGFPLPVVAGAVLSGAYFGDKLSPLSDTTNLAPAMVGTDLYTHIRHMLYTTSVAFALTLIIEFALGFMWGKSGEAHIESITQFHNVLGTQFNISPVLLLPPLLVMAMAVFRISAIPGIAAGALFAALLGILFQGASYETLMGVAYSGYVSDSGVEAVDKLLTKGGLNSMMYTVSLVICAMMFGGIMERTGQMRVLVKAILSRVTSRRGLFSATVFTALGGNMVLCDQYMTLVMTGRMYSQAFRDRGLHPKNLSRVAEDAGTVTASLVPWNSGGAYQSATLGVPTIAYAPFAFFNWLSPLVTLMFGWFGWTIAPLDEPEESDEIEADAENEQVEPGGDRPVIQTDN